MSEKVEEIRDMPDKELQKMLQDVKQRSTGTSSEFTRAAMKRIFERRGGEIIGPNGEVLKKIKSSNGARKALLTTLDELASEIALNAVRYARNSGKNTVTKENVRDATRWVLGTKEVKE